MWIVYGGAFNPPTKAHLCFATRILQEPEVEKLIFMPVGDRYDKPELIAAEHRLAMCRLMAMYDERFEVSSLESDSRVQFGTYHSLMSLQKQHPQQQFAFLTGADNFSYLTTWVEAARLLENFQIWVMPRPGFDSSALLQQEPLLQKNQSHLRFLHFLPLLDISATEIRQQIAAGAGRVDALDDVVMAYIKTHELYGAKL
ncbi:MAG: nicotinate (nicotinamide) nucleotide adenylyltransferase [Negativicutes bacterium]|nr:nicotinate (nicotinamide) nucleotide adenylyltransferase [Negativicutes bacterium]